MADIHYLPKTRVKAKIDYVATSLRHDIICQNMIASNPINQYLYRRSVAEMDEATSRFMAVL